MALRFIAQDGDSGLADHPHRLTLRGVPGDLAFPARCPSCGATANETLPYAKVFRRLHSEAPTEHVVVPVAVPFCGACLTRHRAQEQPLSAGDKLLSAVLTGEFLGAVFPGLAAVFFGWLALGDLMRREGTRFLFMLLLAVVFGFVAWLQARAVWRRTAHLRVPRGTDVTRAFDFSDDLSEVFEPPRFACTMRDPSFAQAFRALNLDREWHAGSPSARAEKRRAQRLLWLAGGALLAAALVSLWHEYF